MFPAHAVIIVSMDHWTVIHPKFIGYPKQNDVAVTELVIHLADLVLIILITKLNYTARDKQEKRQNIMF